MSQVDALKMVEHVRSRLVDLAVSENHFRDRVLSDAARKVWEGPGAEGGLVSELWVEGAFPGLQTKDSLKSLSEEGLFPADLCNHLNYPNKFPSDRYLYNHQSETIRKIAANNKQHKPAFVITAGTGLGKTEAFLLPVLSDLWTAPARKNNGGMRCLILYPMNALIADQVERIYNWLIGQNRLSVFHFTSETPENNWRANRDDEPPWKLCRARTREEARGFETHDGKKIEKEPFGKVPDIVITNYSMLEYMLCRPQDSRFFGPDLRCIIIDEAHLYSGALAAEIMMLLRRLRERCGVSASEVLHIATSATLGGNEEDLRDFASLLFSTNKSETHVIRGQNAEQNLGDSESSPSNSPSTKHIAKYADLDFQTLTPQDELIEDNENTVHVLREFVSLLVSESVLNQSLSIHPTTPARFLYESLREAPLVKRIAEILGKEKGNVISLNDLASRVFKNKNGVDERNATIALLRLSATARQQASDLPLIPHRLHFLVRAPEGLAACLNPKCSGPIERNIPSIGCLQPLGDHCRYCGHITLPVNRCENCGEWALAVHENQELSTLEPGYYSDRTYYLLTRPKNFDPNELYEVVIDSNSGEIRGHGAAGVSLWKAPFISDKSKDQKCPTCHSSWTIHTDEEQQPEWRRTCQRLVGGRPFALSVTTETVLHDLPPYRGKSRHWKPAEGRRLLAFSDSRASAARLGPLLTQQHEMQVIRAAMVRCAKEMVMGGTANYLADEVNRLVDKIEKPGIDPVLR